MRLLLGLSLASPSLGAAFTFLQLSGPDGPWCVQTKDDNTDIGTPFEYGKCDSGPTQRWSYVENQLRLFGEDDRCISLKKGDEGQNAVLASCIPTDDPTVETSWTWNTAKRSSICTCKYTPYADDSRSQAVTCDFSNTLTPIADHGKGAPPQQTWCLSAIGGQEPPKLFLSWRQRSARFEPVLTRTGPIPTDKDKCGAASNEE